MRRILVSVLVIVALCIVMIPAFGKPIARVHFVLPQEDGGVNLKALNPNLKARVVLSERAKAPTEGILSPNIKARVYLVPSGSLAKASTPESVVRGRTHAERQTVARDESRQ